MYEHIYGIVPPMTTPFREDGTIDETFLRADTRYMVDVAKVHGLAVCGSTGEGHTLTTAETRRITEIVIKEVKGRFPVITGIITDSTASAIERGNAVKDLGVAALQVTPPHYLFRPDDDAMLRHFEALTKSTGLPVMIYNVVPWCYLSPQLLTRIIDNVEGVIGVKQSAGDMKMLADLLILLGNRGRIMSAVDALMYPSFVLGAHGAIAAMLSAVPCLYMRLWDAMQAGDHKQALALHEKLLPIWNAIFTDNLPANVKYCMELMGRPAGLPRPPMPPTASERKPLIREALKNAGAI
ncbi:MAG: dihydrodipicolinate synthase family protein [candidate division NC10 bacterium]|nr:dihydrodipicolinate synthase family protein [candidate division NC10 bacterium]